MEDGPADAVLIRGSTAEELAALVRAMIFDGRLAPDEPLREAALSERFAVSRRTVRDALGVLEHEGLVHHHRHRGARVARLTADDVHDLYRVRRSLELAAAQSARTAPDERRRALDDAFGRLRDATRLGRPDEIVERDLEFHRAVVGLLASPRMDRFFATVAVEMRFALAVLERSYQESRRRPKAALDEHRQIHDALTAGNRRLAAQLIAAHIDANEALLVRAVSG